MAPSSTNPRLTILGGPLAGRELSLDEAVDNILIGSDPSCRFHVELPSVSPIHARLWVDWQGVTVYDTGSPQGVYLNDDRVERWSPVRNGDIIWLGHPGNAGSVMIQCRIPPRSQADATKQAATQEAPAAAGTDPDADTDADATLAVPPSSTSKPQPVVPAADDEEGDELRTVVLAGPADFESAGPEAAEPAPTPSPEVETAWIAPDELRAAVTEAAQAVAHVEPPAETPPEAAAVPAPEIVPLEEEPPPTLMVEPEAPPTVLLAAEPAPAVWSEAAQEPATMWVPPPAAPREADEPLKFSVTPDPDALTGAPAVFEEDIEEEVSAPTRVAPSTVLVPPAPVPPAPAPVPPAPVPPVVTPAPPARPAAPVVPPAPAPVPPRAAAPPPAERPAPRRVSESEAEDARAALAVPRPAPTRAPAPAARSGAPAPARTAGGGSSSGLWVAAAVVVVAVLGVGGWYAWKLLSPPAVPVAQSSAPPATLAAQPTPLPVLPTPGVEATPTPAPVVEETVTLVPPSSPAATPTPRATPSPRAGATPPPPAPTAAPATTGPAPEVQRAQQAQALVAQADAALGERRYEDAAVLYTQALQVDPQNQAAAAGRQRAQAAVTASRRTFVAGRSVLQGAKSGKKGVAGFESEDVEMAKAPDYSGRLEFEASPRSVRPGDSFTVRVFLLNDGKKDFKIAAFSAVTASNLERGGGPAAPAAREVAPQKRVLLHELSGVWKDGVTSWTLEVSATSAHGEVVRNTLTWR